MEVDAGGGGFDVDAAYFDVDGDWPTRIDNGQFPKSQLLFRELFRRAGHQVQ